MEVGFLSLLAACSFRHSFQAYLSMNFVEALGGKLSSELSGDRKPDGPNSGCH